MAPITKNIRRSSSFKLITIIFITVAMLIPLSMVESTIHERSGLRHQAESNISERWGATQKISAPVIAIPYREKIVEKITQKNGWQLSDNKIENSKISYVNHIAYLLADKIKVSTKMTTEIRYLGIYEMPVYMTESRISGNFSKKDFETLNKQFKNINWEQAKLILPVEDVRGIRSISRISFARHKYDFVPTSSDIYNFKGIETDINLKQKINSDIKFSFDLSLSGSKQLNYLPLARTSQFSLTSDWSSPGFSGAYLPLTRNISETGFTSEWKVLGLNRSFGQIWNDRSVDNTKIAKSAFGLTLFQPADIYQQNIRSVKYAVLFIALTFMAFFLFEIFFNLNIHPVQYFFNGGALSTFYLLLLAMSEHLHFSVAYLLASIAIVLLMTGYSMTILKQRTRGLIIGLITAIIYAFLYFLIQSEQNSLLFGAFGFFSALTVIMYLTRNIDWYNINSQKSQKIQEQ